MSASVRKLRFVGFLVWALPLVSSLSFRVRAVITRSAQCERVLVLCDAHGGNCRRCCVQFESRLMPTHVPRWKLSGQACPSHHNDGQIGIIIISPP